MRKSGKLVKFELPESERVDVCALLSELPPEKLAEMVGLECYEWTPSMSRKVMSQLAPQQKALCNELAGSTGETPKELMDALHLASQTELDQAFAELRNQLTAMGINPQEVYHVGYVVFPSKESGRNELWPTYYPSDQFDDAYERVKDPKR